MTEHTEGADREALRRWARLNGHEAAQAEAIATDPDAHRAALAAWLTARGLDPAQASDPTMPQDPVILAEWGPIQGVQPNTAEVWSTQGEGFPERHTIGLRPVEGARAAHAVAAQEFTPGERVARETYGRRTGMAVTTVKRAVAGHADQAPEADDHGLFDAHALAAFLVAVRNPGPGLYSLAELDAWQVGRVRPSPVPVVDPTLFQPKERVDVKEFCARTGRDRSTLSKALNNPRYQGENAEPQVPTRGKDRKFDARELAAFCNALPRRRGRPPKKADN